ncbi:hypothetical protein AnaeK_0465 [Anaeromyxobacter sp. K]|nr:hypothetical protein AnaeK_0465 [Anaeromyxobacter sp. K]
MMGLFCMASHNCQDWAGETCKAYARLSKDPTVQEDCKPCGK